MNTFENDAHNSTATTRAASKNMSATADPNRNVAVTLEDLSKWVTDFTKSAHKEIL